MKIDPPPAVLVPLRRDVATALENATSTGDVRVHWDRRSDALVRAHANLFAASEHRIAGAQIRQSAPVSPPQVDTAMKALYPEFAKLGVETVSDMMRLADPSLTGVLQGADVLVAGLDFWDRMLDRDEKGLVPVLFSGAKLTVGAAKFMPLPSNLKLGLTAVGMLVKYGDRSYALMSKIDNNAKRQALAAVSPATVSPAAP